MRTRIWRDIWDPLPELPGSPVDFMNDHQDSRLRSRYPIGNAPTFFLSSLSI